MEFMTLLHGSALVHLHPADISTAIAVIIGGVLSVPLLVGILHVMTVSRGR